MRKKGNEANQHIQDNQYYKDRLVSILKKHGNKEQEKDTPPKKEKNKERLTKAGKYPNQITCDKQQSINPNIYREQFAQIDFQAKIPHLPK